MSLWRSLARTMPLLAGVVLLLGATPAVAADPFAGPQRFPQFRNISGLSGGGFGVDVDGRRSLAGPAAFSTPIAHVLGHGQWQLVAGGSSSRRSLSFGGVNGTAALGYGHTFGRLNVMASVMALSRVEDLAVNLQVQLPPDPLGRWAFSVGVQDIGGGGGAAGEGVPGDERSSRSFFGVVTGRISEGARPLYLSAGVGSNRFKHGFASASLQVAEPLRVWAEYDGFGVNIGILAATRSLADRRPVDLVLSLGLLKGRYPAVAASLGF
jgi:hypothetical protein